MLATCTVSASSWTCWFTNHVSVVAFLRMVSSMFAEFSLLRFRPRTHRSTAQTSVIPLNGNDLRFVPLFNLRTPPRRLSRGHTVAVPSSSPHPAIHLRSFRSPFKHRSYKSLSSYTPDVKAWSDGDWNTNHRTHFLQHTLTSDPSR